MTEAPTPQQIVQLRYACGLTQTQFGELLHSKLRTVQHWEKGTAAMHPGLWELALLKLDKKVLQEA